jgi:hypothetical protein
MPFDIVMIFASTILSAVDRERASDARKQPGMIGRIERDLGHGARRIDPLLAIWSGVGATCSTFRSTSCSTLDQYLFRERSAVSGRRQASARVFA